MTAEVQLECSPRPWAEAVFHVLAHVRASARLPASLWEPAWVDFVERVAGPASERLLAEDAAVLGELLSSHEALSRAQLLAWAFRDLARARAGAAVELSQLQPDALDAPELLPTLREQGAPIEILRCAALLELPVLAALPVRESDPADVQRALGQVAPAAPGLFSRRVLLLRPLGLRGRVRGGEIWVGAPTARGPTAEHVAWQAAHEATVAEAHDVARALATPLGERALEHAALVTLAERALEHGLGERHATWVAHFSTTPPLKRGDAPSAVQALVAALRAGAGSGRARSAT